MNKKTKNNTFRKQKYIFMNWKLIFVLLLLFCLSTDYTIELLPSSFKLFYGISIWLSCAYLVAKHAPGKYFLFGFLLGVSMNLSVLSRSLIFHETGSLNPYWPLTGIITSSAFGLLCFIASLFIKKIRFKSSMGQ